MSTAYTTNQPWAQQQQQAMYAQPQQNGQSYNFPSSSTTVNGTQHQQDPQGQYSAYSSQMIHPNGQTSPDMLHANYSSPQQAPHGGDRRNGSFGTSHGTSNTFSGTYTPNTNMDSFNGQNGQYATSSPDQLSWSNSAAFSFQRGPQHQPSSFTAPYDGSQPFASSPTAMQENFPINGNYSSPNGRPEKRPHTSMDEEQEGPGDAKEQAKVKPGACARCKTLKVKCEFKTETDPCKRCLNSGNECVIPGRKKRRTPPKREHLLNQIREQADQIKKLMAQLEASGGGGVRRRRLSATSDSLASASDLQSPMMSSDGYLDSYSPVDDTETNKDIEAWIAKAKASFQDFDSFIGVGGAGMAKSYILDEDLENPNGSDDDDNFYDAQDNHGEYEIAVEHHDEEDPVSGQNSGHPSPGKLRHRSSASSINTNSTTGVSSNNRKKMSADNSGPATLPGEAAPFGLFGKLSLKTRGQSVGPDDEEEEKHESAGIANSDFFKPTGPAPQAEERLQNMPAAPLILQRRIITPQEAEKLFEIFFNYMNLSVSLLDPVLYTAQRTCFRSPFLFTVICGIASRFYSEKPGLYGQIMPYAQQAAGNALISGPKTVDMVAAYILLSLYPVPTKRWEDQRNWLYLGLAIRTATDLNLHLPTTAKPVNENHAREMLNRTRIWMNCFNLDRSTGSQYGKPPIISPTDFIASNSEDWWKSSPHNMKEFDIHLCAYNAELKVMAGFIGKIYGNPHHPTGLKKDVDFEKIASETDEELKQLSAKWLARLEDVTTAQGQFRTGLLKLAYPYARLVALSYGFQHAFGKNNTDENPFLNRCLDAAFDVVIPVLEDLCKPSQLVFIRHGPEAQVVFISFASAFLVKLLQPKFAAWVPIEKRVQIRDLVQRVVEVLGSPEVVVDDRHALKLYSKFLRNLLNSPMAKSDPTSPSMGGRKPRPINTSTRSTPDPTSDSNFGRFRSSASSGSMSPPARAAALSFNNFAPAGGVDPFGPESSLGLTMDTNYFVEDGSSNNMISEFLQPPLPFDDAILHSMQSLSEPSGWQDTTMSTDYAWNNFSQSYGMDFRNHADNGVHYNQFMTGA